MITFTNFLFFWGAIFGIVWAVPMIVVYGYDVLKVLWTMVRYGWRK